MFRPTASTYVARSLGSALLAVGASCADLPERSESELLGRDQALVSITPLTAPPSYQGTLTGANCGSQQYPTKGFRPTNVANGKKYPLFLYFVGTITGSGAEDGYDSDAPNAVTEAMAQREYVALSVKYDAGLDVAPNQILTKAACLFDPNRADSLIATACASPYVNCELGVVTWGHSQGGVLAALAASYDARVRAAWTTGVGQTPESRPYTITLNLPSSRLRIVNGENDTGSNNRAALNEITGKNCQTGLNCLDPADNNAGWYLVAANQLQQNPADHCWFFRDNGLFPCSGPVSLEPNWENGSLPFSLSSNADWLKTAGLGTPISRKLAFDFKGFGGGWPTALTGQYPAGTVDWGTASNFTAFDNGTTRHAFIGPAAYDLEARGTFTLWGPQGRTLTTVTAFNSDVFVDAFVSFKVTKTNGEDVTRTFGPIPRQEERPLALNIPNAKSVEITSSRGARVQFRRFEVDGPAAKKL
jgi:hypothetical protein